MSPLSYHATDSSCDVLVSFAVAVVLRRGCVGTRAVRRCALARGGRLGGAVVVDWAFVWCEWCRLVVVAVCELQKSARARAEGLEGGWRSDS